MERRNFLKATGGALLGSTALAAGSAQGRTDVGYENYHDYSGMVKNIPDLDLLRVKHKYNPLRSNEYVYELTFQFQDHADGWVDVRAGQGNGNERSFSVRADSEGTSDFTFHSDVKIDSVYVFDR